MKLYTEEQLEQAIKMARSSPNIFQTPFIYDKFEIIHSLTPIELPTDEEIEETLGTAGGGLFAKGAKWMRDKIKGGEQ